MSIAASDLVEPVGRLEPAWFVGEGDDHAFMQRLDGYVTDAETRAAALSHLGGPEQDEAAKAWAYYRAFSYLHLSLQRVPASMGVTAEGNRQYLKSQLQAWQQEADNALAEWNQWATTQQVAPGATVASSTSPNSFLW